MNLNKSLKRFIAQLLGRNKQTAKNVASDQKVPSEVTSYSTVLSQLPLQDNTTEMDTEKINPEQKSIIYFPFEKYPKLAALQRINPTCKDGRCFEAHQQVHDFLVKGKEPVNVEKIVYDKLRLERIEGKDYISYGTATKDERWKAINSIIEAAETNGSVYAVDMEDHAFNLLKLDDKLYLLDASFGLFKEIKSPDDFRYTREELPNFPEDQDYVLDGLNMLNDLPFSIANVGVINPKLLGLFVDNVSDETKTKTYRLI